MAENIGKITQVLGPVVDVEFEQGKLPEVLTALLITNTAINDQGQADYDARWRRRTGAGLKCCRASRGRSGRG